MSVSARAARRQMPAPPSGEGERPLTFVWRVHAAQGSWTGNADVKASVLLALEGGVLFATIAAIGSGRLLLGRGDRIAAAVGLIAVLLAIAAGTVAIFPRLGQRDKDPQSHRQVIYFGDLRHWKAQQLGAYISDLGADEQLQVLCQQITEMARLNWAKHRWVQASLVLSLTGITIISVAAVLTL
jgi:hypothetical protein